ncbi:MAG: homocysteine S-methyltransferase family protein, partial [Pseudomonadales bacterium]|nr:homocysteine S-methyltransferase family protein [Pseudomonadales bacterium]
HIPAGWTVDNEVQAGHYEMTDEEFRAYAVIWREQGAQIIGGCCGIGPQHIRALGYALIARKHKGPPAKMVLPGCVLPKEALFWRMQNSEFFLIYRTRECGNR